MHTLVPRLEFGKAQHSVLAWRPVGNLHMMQSSSDQAYLIQEIGVLIFLIAAMVGICLGGTAGRTIAVTPWLDVCDVSQGHTRGARLSLPFGLYGMMQIKSINSYIGALSAQVVLDKKQCCSVRKKAAS